MTTIRLLNSKGFDYAAIDPACFDFGSVATALSHICRFTGHTHSHYSVAQHSVLVSHLVEPRYAAHALLHDAAEAFIGDINSPLKRMIDEHSDMFIYKLEAAIMDVIESKFIPLPEWTDTEWKQCRAAVKRADMIAFHIERKEYCGCASAHG